MIRRASQLQQAYSCIRHTQSGWQSGERVQGVSRASRYHLEQAAERPRHLSADPPAHEPGQVAGVRDCAGDDVYSTIFRHVETPRSNHTAGRISNDDLRSRARILVESRNVMSSVSVVSEEVHQAWRTVRS